MSGIVDGDYRAPILLISRNFPPLVGGVEALMKSTFEVLSDEHPVILIGPSGCAAHAKRAMNIIQIPQATLLFLPLALLVSIYMGLRYRPVRIVGSNGLMAPLVRAAALVAGKPSVLFLHGLDLVTPSRLYSWFFLPHVRKMTQLVANSANTAKLAVGLGVPEAKVHVVNPCIEVPTNELPSGAFVGRLESQKPFILYAGRVIPRKGLLEFLEGCGEWLRTSGLRLVVAGDAPVGGAGGNQDGYIRDVQRLVSELELSSYVTFLGRVSDPELAYCFQKASLHLMPLVEVEGDVEGFGMVAVEAASHGTPTVAFDLGGVRDAVEDESLLVIANDYEALRQKMSEVITNPPERGSLLAWAHRFYPESYAQRLRSIQ